MKQLVTGGGGGRSRLRLLTEEEVEVAEILASLPEIVAKSEFINRKVFSWGAKKKRSEPGLKPESSSVNVRPVGESTPEKLAAGEEGKSPSTPLNFLPSGSGSDGSGNGKQSSLVKKNLKRKVADDLVESYISLQQEQECLSREIKAMESLHQKLVSKNLELKSIIQKVNYSRNIEDFHQLNNHPQMSQMTMFAPPTPQQQHCQQLVVDPHNGKRVAVSCSGNSHGDGRFGLFNQVGPRVKIHGEAYDRMASSQPLDQTQYLVMNSDLKVRYAADARKKRILRMKENKALKLSRGSSR